MKPAFFLGAIVILLGLTFGIAALAKEPFFEGVGSYSRKITTDSRQAQRYFNQRRQKKSSRNSGLKPTRKSTAPAFANRSKTACDGGGEVKIGERIGTRH